MTNQSITASSCLSRLFERLRFNALSPDSSSNFSPLTRLISQISAAGLVLASSGFGAYYAWTTGTQHGAVLGALMVVMAIALELAKPLSLMGALAAFRAWSVFRGAALALLAIVAIAYSLTSELSLMATSKSDVIATRAASIKVASGIELDVKRAQESYERAKAELATLPKAKTASELQAEIDGLLLTPGTDGCVAINGKVTSDVCPQVATLKADKARADRRSQLERIVTSPLPTLPVTSQNSVSQSDPAATALSTYLAIFGITVAPALLSEWLVLVGVLALEIGSAMAGLLAQSFSGPPPHARPNVVKADVVQPSKMLAPVQVVHPANTGEPEDTVQAREKVKSAIVGRLKEQGGQVKAGERGLAKLIGTNRSTMKRAINGLVMAGVIAAEATRNGTVVRLVT